MSTAAFRSSTTSLSWRSGLCHGLLACALLTPGPSFAGESTCLAELETDAATVAEYEEALLQLQDELAWSDALRDTLLEVYRVSRDVSWSEFEAPAQAAFARYKWAGADAKFVAAYEEELSAAVDGCRESPAWAIGDASGSQMLLCFATMSTGGSTAAIERICQEEVD